MLLPFTSHSVSMFALYLVTTIILWAAFNWAYTTMTPWSEKEDIRAGKMEPAIALVGAEIGFMIPFAAAAFHSGNNYLAFIGWVALSGLVQLGLFKLMWMRYEGIGNLAVATTFAGASVCAGIAIAVSQLP